MGDFSSGIIAALVFVPESDFLGEVVLSSQNFRNTSDKKLVHLYNVARVPASSFYLLSHHTVGGAGSRF